MFLILLNYILSAVSRQDHSGTYKVCYANVETF